MLQHRQTIAPQSSGDLVDGPKKRRAFTWTATSSCPACRPPTTATTLWCAHLCVHLSLHTWNVVAFCCLGCHVCAYSSWVRVGMLMHLLGIYVLNCQFYNEAPSGNIQDLCAFEFYALWFVIYLIIVQSALLFIDTLVSVAVVCIYICFYY